MFLNANTTGTDAFNSYIELANKQIAKYGKQFLNPDVCVDNIADGRIAVSIPNAESIGKATVVEQPP